jgi:hypothetical protein
MNRILDQTGAPAHVWLLCLQYICYLLNHTYNSTINAVPLARLHGTTIDISPLQRFHFWEFIYYLKSETSFPSDSKEGLGNVIGVSEHCGHALMYKILTADTGHVIYRSLLHPANTDDANLCASMFAGEPDTITKLLHPEITSHNHVIQMSTNLLPLSHHRQYSTHKILLDGLF